MAKAIKPDSDQVYYTDRGMNFYEVANGWPVCVYVWAPDEATARQLAQASYEKDGRECGYNPEYWDPAGLEIKHLFSASYAPFATVPSRGYWMGRKES